jgi:hypothetical protein
MIVGIHVDYSNNHKLFEMVDENAFHQLTWRVEALLRARKPSQSSHAY